MHRNVFKDSGRRIRRIVYPYLLVLPALAMYGFFLVLPMVQNYVFSFLSWAPGSYGGFAGLSNYIRLFTDPIFTTAFSHNVMWMALYLVFPVVIGLVLAAILAGRIRGRVIFSTIYFVPCTVALVVAATIWSWMYNPIFGPINTTLRSLGLGTLAKPWLGDRKLALYALNLAGSWALVGFCVVIFLSSLQSISPELYEAAQIDGASTVQAFWCITVPAIKQTILFVALYSCIMSLKIFDIIWITTKGGPAHATEVLESYMYFLFFTADEVSYSSSIVSILSTIVLILSVALIYLYRKAGLEKRGVK